MNQEEEEKPCTITKEQFMAVEKVRRSGKTNMFDLPMVCKLSNLEQDVVLEIFHHYSELTEKFMVTRTSGK